MKRSAENPLEYAILSIDASHPEVDDMSAIFLEVLPENFNLHTSDILSYAPNSDYHGRIQLEAVGAPKNIQEFNRLVALCNEEWKPLAGQAIEITVFNIKDLMAEEAGASLKMRLTAEHDDPSIVFDVEQNIGDFISLS